MSLTNRGDTVGDSAETIATLCRTYREEGSLADAQAALRQGLAAHPRDVRLLVERVLLDNLSEQQQGRCPGTSRKADRASRSFSAFTMLWTTRSDAST